MKKLSVIWDMTANCPFHCPICCMGATSCPDQPDELPYGLKYAVAAQLAQLAASYHIRVDLSGGEIMTDLRNLDIAQAISDILGKENVGISSSGYGIDRAVAARLSTIVHEVELTMDTPPGVPYRLRPLAYAKAAADAVPFLKKSNIHTGIQTVLTKSNGTRKNLTALYRWLCDHQVDEWSLLCFFPSGRGADFSEEALDDESLLKIVRMIQEMDARNVSPRKPSLHFHYTIKGHDCYTTECRCVKKSIGIFPNGDVTACFWASDRNTNISNDIFHLGNIRTETLSQILLNPKSRYWLEQVHTCPLRTDLGKERFHVFTSEHCDRIA